MKSANYLYISILLLGCIGCTAVNVEVVTEMESGYIPSQVRPKAPIDPKELPRLPITSSFQSDPPAQCPARGNNGINIKAKATPQDTDVWCWVASAEMVMRAHGTDVEQCNIVNRIQNRDGELTAEDKPFCCGENGLFPPPCHTNGWPDQAFEKYDYNWGYTDGPLTIEEVKGQLCETGPFIYVLLYEGRGGHSIVVKDYQEIEGEELVLLVHDHQWVENTNPRVATEIYPISYSDFRNGIWEGRRYKHELDYVQISPKPTSP
ncbi:MAG: C39 family peptidase [Nitrospirales bacterium]